jgi:heme-degrading monooxygenase HmoA
LANAKLLRPELEQMVGFVDNVRYRSLSREGWILSLSNWDDEKALVRWRTQAKHHDIQRKGRDEIFLDYHLRVGQITRDTHLRTGHVLREQRLDETEIGEGTTVTLIDAARSKEWVERTCHEDIARWLGLDLDAQGLVAWEAFDAVLTSGDVILLASWRGHESAEIFESAAMLPTGARLRRIRVVRDYGMFDRRESPQYYPEAERTS